MYTYFWLLLYHMCDSSEVLLCWTADNSPLSKSIDEVKLKQQIKSANSFMLGHYIRLKLSADSVLSWWWHVILVLLIPLLNKKDRKSVV